ncbi:hypothetical protein UC8_45270 [Roseimaritima ulvae]|uniref:Transposase IS204/IS1001/IS1096/IS1165 DDE domain-containing protein n=2 Tax=Roseimaritima ulvae TaxID=980254 RepID=A0A5B9QTX8_9BACT|nr:hypothetical protein UC8_45270 [Roseimaritima ulvae]
MKIVAWTIRERLPNAASYRTHRITNAVAEGINSKTIPAKRRVGGYRTRENFTSAFYFYLGGLDLYSRSPPKPLQALNRIRVSND